MGLLSFFVGFTILNMRSFLWSHGENWCITSWEYQKMERGKVGLKSSPNLVEKYKGNAATRKQTSNEINLKKPKMLRGVKINI